jgi:hypothetical protein
MIGAGLSKDENRPQLNSATTFNNLIIITKEVGVNGRRCTASLKCKPTILTSRIRL